MLTFLKKAGQLLVNLAGIAGGIGPIFRPLLGSSEAGKIVSTGLNDLTAIGGVIVQIETAFAAIPNSSGAMKLQAAIPLVGNIIKTSELIAGKKIANDELFTKAIQEYAQATVDLLNSLSEDSVHKA